MKSAAMKSLIVLVGVVAIASAADLHAQVTNVTLPDLQGMVGDRVSTDLVLEGAPGITGITIDIGFNPLLVTPSTDITMGAFGNSIQNVHGANILGNDTLRVVVAAADTNGYIGSGVLLTIDWDLAAAGLTSLGFISVLLENNQSPPPLPFTSEDGSITIEGSGSDPCPCPPGEARVLVNDKQGRQGDRLTFDIAVQELPAALDAFGLELTYDTAVLSYVSDSGQCAGLTDGWFSCGTSEATPGVITIGAFDTNQVPAGSSGTIARLSFDVVCATCVDGDTSLLEITDLVDDLAGIPVCCGVFTYGERCFSDGDVNADGALSPGDAQCAFKMFFNDQAVTPECEVEGSCEVAAADVNCDGTVTPGDALGIFSRWLANGNPEDCFSQGAPRPQSTRAGAISVAELFELETEELADRRTGRVRLPIIMRAVAGPAAFAMEIGFDPGSIEFVDLVASPAGSTWRGLAAREVEPGRLVAGGYSATGLDAERLARGEDVVLGHLEFTKTTAAPIAPARVRWIERTVGARSQGPGRGELAPAAGYRLGWLSPNPARAAMAGAVIVPAGGEHVVRVTVFDVHGRKIRTVLDDVLPAGVHRVQWDRTSDAGEPMAPGIYFVRMTAGTFAAVRKVTVVD